MILNIFLNQAWCVFICFSCCGAGTAADTEYTTQIISANIELHRLETQKKVLLTLVLVSCIYFNQLSFFGREYIKKKLEII